MTSECFSGGARGADAVWAGAALDVGHRVIHYSFHGHTVLAPGEVVKLKQAKLNIALPKLVRANATLDRTVPAPGFVRNLLLRDWWQVEHSDRVYAISHLERGVVAGGTAWAIQMAIDDACIKEIYLYDQAERVWYTWRGGWRKARQVPRPHGSYAAIGSRELLPAGRRAIKRLVTTDA